MGDGHLTQKSARYDRRVGPASSAETLTGGVVTVQRSASGLSHPGWLGRIGVRWRAEARQEPHRGATARQGAVLQAVGLAAFETIPHPVLAIDEDERPVAVNGAFEKLFGLTCEDLAEVGWRRILGGGGRGLSLDRLSAKPLWGSSLYVLRNSRGQRFQARLWTASSGGDDRLRIIGIQDVSQEIAARREKECLRQALDAVPIAILYLNDVDDVMAVNPCAETLLGQKGEHLRGLPLSFLMSQNRPDLGHSGPWPGRLIYGVMPRDVQIHELCCTIDGPIARVIAIREAPAERPVPAEASPADGAKLLHKLRQPLHGIRLQAEAIVDNLGRPSARDRALRIVQESDRLEAGLQEALVGSGSDVETERRMSRGDGRPGEAADPGAASGARILVVDDEALSLMVVEQSLSSLGHAVDLAFDGAEALGLIAETTYDLVVTDLSMPDVRGEDLVHHLAQCAPRTPVIVVSGRSEAPTLGNIVAFIPKPFALTTLKDTVGRVLAEGGSERTSS